jgi:hypothetical protein
MMDAGCDGRGLACRDRIGFPCMIDCLLRAVSVKIDERLDRLVAEAIAATAPRVHEKGLPRRRRLPRERSAPGVPLRLRDRRPTSPSRTPTPQTRS